MAIGSFDNPITGIDGELVINQIKSSNFTLSPLDGWAVLKNGNAYFANITITGKFMGTDFIIDSDGIFLYTGVPAAGNLFASMASQNGTDSFGNNYFKGLQMGNQQAAHFGVDTSGNLNIANAADKNVYQVNSSDGSQLTYNSSGVGAGNLIISISPTAGTDSVGNAYPAGIQITEGVISGTIFEGTDFIINEQGAFFYTGTPANGNLFCTIASANGTDSFGNNYFAGFQIGDQQASHFGSDILGNLNIADSSNKNVYQVRSANGGQFTYNSSGAGLGTLISSVAPAPGRDSYGNYYGGGTGSNLPGGIFSYQADPTGNDDLYCGLTQGIAQFSGGSNTTNGIIAQQLIAGASGHLVAALGLESGLADSSLDLAEIILQSANTFGDIPLIYITSANADSQIVADAMQSNGGLLTNIVVGFEPGSSLSAIETWHNMTLLNSWAVQSGSYCRYKYMPDNSVWIQGRVVAGTTTTGTAIWTIPTGYIPIHSQVINLVQESNSGGGTVAENTPFFLAEQSGSLVVSNMYSNAVNISFNGRYTLD
jgi:hypothetical protein